MDHRQKVSDHYDRMNEAGRLAEGEGRFEYLRSLMGASAHIMAVAETPA